MRNGFLRSLSDLDAPQRDYTLRGLFNALRYMIRAGCPWRMIPNDLPPLWTVHQQAQRWIKAGCFEAMAHDLREVLLVAAEKPAQPSAVILDGRTLQSTPESGHRAGYDPVTQRLLPLDETWRHNLAKLPWPTQNLPEVLGDGTETLRAPAPNRSRAKTPAASPPCSAPTKISTNSWSLSKAASIASAKAASTKNSST